MARCEVCGNDYDKSMEITVAGATHVFDSFECAIHAIAPRCEHCDCVIIGHGLEATATSTAAPTARAARATTSWRTARTSRRTPEARLGTAAGVTGA